MPALHPDTHTCLGPAFLATSVNVVSTAIGLAVTWIPDVSDLNDFFSGSFIVNFPWGHEQMSAHPHKKPTKDQRNNIIQL